MISPFTAVTAGYYNEMSKKRRQNARSTKDPNGKGYLCSCGCRRKPKPPRRTWFSTECVHEWRIKNDPGYVRDVLLDRDKGVCADCGRDTRKLYQQFRRIMWKTSGDSWRWMDTSQKREFHSKPIRHLSRWLEASGFPKYRASWWDADHIVEVIRGGGQCGLDNYQTLCVPCHKDKTKGLARDRATERKLKIKCGCAEESLVQLALL